MKKAHNLFILFLALFIVSCDDIVEEDIENDTVQTIFPTENAVIEGNTVQFSWQSLDGADDYRIQIINSSQAVVIDSLVSVTSINFLLNPDDYQWRIKGENFAYTTQYTFPINFSVQASDDLTNQTLSLLTPSENFYTNNTNIVLTWSSLISADSYSLEVIKDNGGQSTVLQEQNITTTNYTLPANIFDEDALFVWKVKAVNLTSETSFSERSLFIDREVPGQPALVFPNDLDSFDTTTVNFNWTIGSDSGAIQSARTNTIEISSDINFGTTILVDNVDSNSYQYVFSDAGTYYWRVLTFDEAGNTGDYSSVRSLTIE